MQEGTIVCQSIVVVFRSVRRDKHRIGEYDNKIPSDLTAEQILIRSGNIGSVRIAQLVGPEKHKSFLKKVGILSPIDFDIDEIAPQKNYNLSKCRLATASFGHGVATTILQLAKGYAVISNGGYDIKPSLIKKNTETKEKKSRLINKGVSNQVVTALRKIVNTEEGSATASGHGSRVYVDVLYTRRRLPSQV